MASLKGPGEAQKHDGSGLRIGIVHARWNTSKQLTYPYCVRSLVNSEIAIIDPLLAGAKTSLLGLGVKESNIVVQSVPGSWELPIACSK